MFAAGQKVIVGGIEIVAHHGDDLDRGEVAGGQGDIGGGAAEHAVHVPVRRLDAVIGDGTNDNKGHVSSIVSALQRSIALRFEIKWPVCKARKADAATS